MRRQKSDEKKRQPPPLGRVQMRIMQVLWSCDEATARDITDELNRRGKALPGASPLAHSTVQTLLRQLEAKGMATHEKRERTFVFRATQPREEIAATATRDLLARVFDSSVSSLVAHLLRHEPISRDEMARLRELIAATEEIEAGGKWRQPDSTAKARRQKEIKA